MIMMRVGLSQIASSMRHRKSAYASLVLEVALGCTVVAYVLALSQGLRSVAGLPLGFDASSTFTLALEEPARGSSEQRYARELAELRDLPGVAAAAWIELPLLSRRELPETLMTGDGLRLIWSIRGDEQLAHVLGISPSLGRELRAHDAQQPRPVPVLISSALADKLGSAPLGATLSSPGLGSLSVVGVIPRAIRLSPFFVTGATDMVILPGRPGQARRNTYLVRTSPQASNGFAREARARLRGARPDRWLSITRLSDAREHIIRNIKGADLVILITVLGMVTVVLVGSLGMSSSLVVERARQIGIRRALGARRSDIVFYFMLENLFATLLGLLLAAGLCALLDVLLVGVRSPLQIDWRQYLPLAAVLFLLSGQLAVLLPARRASHMAPSIASRAV
jgi:putative ABC transport system permease protein